MNCIPEMQVSTCWQALAQRCSAVLLRPAALLPVIGATVAVVACGVPSSDGAAQTASERNQYRLEFEVTPDIAAAGAHVELKLTQTRRQLRKLTMRIDARRIQDIEGDSGLRIDGDLLTWVPGQRGGSLKWFASLRHRRGGGNHDAYLDTDWAVFRGEDIIPRASTRTVKNANSETWLNFRLPAGWSSTTPYYGTDDRYRINNPERRFDLPSGWIALGKLGVRYERIGDTRVKVAGPLGQGIRRMDTLAFLHWTLPEFQRLLPTFPKRLTIVSAGEPMWRGGLSGPHSLFLHADLPLITENSTSTLLHEVFHVGFAPYHPEQADWIIEGLAEYYSLKILAHSGGISDKRRMQALAFQAEWGKSAPRVCEGDTSGAVTARAVTVFSTLDEEIRRESGNRHSLDDVIRTLATDATDATLPSLRSGVAELIGKAPVSLSAKNLPGCGA